MSRQTGFISGFILRLLAFILLSLAFAFVYIEISEYNFPVHIKAGKYIIDTYAGFILFLLLAAFSLLFLLNSIFFSIFDKFQYLRKKYRKSKESKALAYLIESCILLTFNDKKGAKEHISKIDTSYLKNEFKIYFNLLKSISSSESIPITLYGYMQNFPFIKSNMSKKLAGVEYKLGNLDKALSYAKEYSNNIENNEDIVLILAQIYYEKKQWRDMDSSINSLNIENKEIKNKEAFANLYISAAKELVSDGNSDEVLNYCKNAIEIMPSNIDAASLFAEVALSNGNYEFIRIVLLNAFYQYPNFNIFLVLHKFSNITNEELYYLLLEKVNFKEHLDLFLAITSVLNLPEQKNELLNYIG